MGSVDPVRAIIQRGCGTALRTPARAPHADCVTAHLQNSDLNCTPYGIQPAKAALRSSAQPP